MSTKIHRLHELYCFLEHYCPEGHNEDFITLWERFVKWNNARFWSVFKQKSRDFVKPVNVYLRDRALARELLDLQTNYEMKQTQKRKKNHQLQRGQYAGFP